MINLVPSAGLQAIKKEYWLRVVSVWLLLLGSICIVGIVLLLPSYIRLTMQINDVNAASNTLNESATSFDVSAAQLVEANNQAQLLVQGTDAAAYTEYIAAAESVADQGIAIDSFVLSAASTATNFTLTGEAATRQDLESFRDALEVLPVFLAVQLPISNFITDRDITFSMNISIASSSSAI